MKNRYYKISTIDLFRNRVKNKEVIEIVGWVKSNRVNNRLGFLIVNDGSDFKNVQVVYKFKNLVNFCEISNCNISSVVRIRGEFCLTLNNKQQFEIQANEIEVLDRAVLDYPLQKKKHTFEFLREIAHLRAKTSTFNAIFRIRSSCAFAIHEFFNKNNFVYIHTPIITSNDAEGAGKSFVVATRDDNNRYCDSFFSKKVNLTVSGQLHVESFAQAFCSVYTFGPVFRAENSNTTKHAAEFWMVEPEVAFSDINDNMNLAENMIKYVLNYLLEHNLEELNFLNESVDSNLIKRLEKIRTAKFTIINYSDGIKILIDAINNNYKFNNNNIFWGMNLQTEHEKYLCEIYNNNFPVFLINFPKKIKAFYMKLNNDNETVAAFDLLFPGVGELIGGSQRENNYQKIINSCNEIGVSVNELQWYLDLRKFGYYKSSGFGLGFERLIMYVTGIKNIRDVIPFPRTFNNLFF